MAFGNSSIFPVFVINPQSFRKSKCSVRSHETSNVCCGKHISGDGQSKDDSEWKSCASKSSLSSDLTNCYLIHHNALIRNFLAEYVLQSGNIFYLLLVAFKVCCKCLITLEFVFKGVLHHDYLSRFHADAASLLRYSPINRSVFGDQEK